MVKDSEESDDEFESGAVPFPFCVASFVTVGIIGATKLVASGVGFVASSIGVWGILAPASWVAIGIYLPT